MPKRRLLLVLGLVVLVVPVLAAVLATSAESAPSTTPSGERMAGKAMLIPIYNTETGGLLYGSTPMGPDDIPGQPGPPMWPAAANPSAQSLFYIVAYPVGTTVGTLQCAHVPMDTCPDHGPLVAQGAAAILPSVYGGPDTLGVLGHDHLSPPHASGDFHVTEAPRLVLFTNKAFANEHLTTLAAINAAAAVGHVIVVDPAVLGLDLSFLNALVNQAAYDHATPVTPVAP
jgi:hypothetical protein